MIGEPQTPQRMLRQVMRKLGHKAAPFSLIVLGMGEDGHIASLFPADQLAAWGQHPSGHCQWVQRRGEDFLRVSLGWQALREAEQVWLVLFGRAKMQALQSWLCSGDSSIPIVQLSQIRDLVVFWSP
jgi:6-phosphogluconolactonase